MAAGRHEVADALASDDMGDEPRATRRIGGRIRAPCIVAA